MPLLRPFRDPFLQKEFCTLHSTLCFDPTKEPCRVVYRRGHNGRFAPHIPGYSGVSPSPVLVQMSHEKYNGIRRDIYDIITFKCHDIYDMYDILCESM